MVSAHDNLVGEMTITKVVSGHHSATVDSCFTAHQYSVADEPGHPKSI